MTLEKIAKYEQQFLTFVLAEEHTDAAHDVSHIQRVVKTARKLAEEEQAELAVVIPAAWLHDCVSLPKNHPNRANASQLAADKAIDFLTLIAFPNAFFPAIHHAITAHSYSAGITPMTLEAKIVQDADRLDALGATGIARCIQVSGSLNRSLYSVNDPFCKEREQDDSQFAIDHFYSKLFRLRETLHTSSARSEGAKREQFMRDFLAQLAQEI